MSKNKTKKRNGNHNKKFAKLRKLLANSEVIATETIYLDGKLSSDEPPRISCTCSWSSERSADLLKLGNLAKQHEVENPGHYRRQH